MSIADACADVGCDEPRAAPDTVDDPHYDQLGRIDTAALYQPFLEAINGVLSRSYARGAIYIATCGNRSFTEQDKLYALGRINGVSGHIVTKARGGQSPHNFKGAIDFARHRGSVYAGKLDPDYSDAAYEVLAEEAERIGLESGLRWPRPFVDSPHVQLPIKHWGYSWAQLAAIWRAGGDAALFAEYDKHWGGARPTNVV